MKKYHHMISEDIYRRVYRLMNQRVEPPLIAATINLPLTTILNIIGRLEKQPELANSESDAPAIVEQINNEAFLDVYCFTKSKYTMVQFVGHLVKESKEILERELHTVQAAVWKSAALQMAEVVALDGTCAKIILEFCKEMKSRERYVALLSPSTPIEPVLLEHKMEEHVPIFGTTTAFEKGALAFKTPAPASRSRSRHHLT